MDALVANLVEAYRESISNLDWMTDATRTRALEKLDKFTPKIGFPVKWRDYSKLAIDAGRPARQRAGDERVRVRSASSARSASPSTATSGS